MGRWREEGHDEGGGVNRGGEGASLALNSSLAASLSPSQSGRHREGPRGWVCDCIVGQGAGQACASWIRLFWPGIGCGHSNRERQLPFLWPTAVRVAGTQKLRFSLQVLSDVPFWMFSLRVLSTGPFLGSVFGSFFGRTSM